MKKKKINQNIVAFIVATILMIASFLLMELTDLGTSGIVKYNDGYGLFDMHSEGYTAEQAYTILDKMGEEGISHYLNFFVADYVFVISGFFSLFLFSLYLLKGGRFKWISIGMVISTTLKSVCDFAEDTLLVIVMKQFPHRLDTLISISSVLTYVKVKAFQLFLILLLLWVIVQLISKFIRKK